MATRPRSSRSSFFAARSDPGQGWRLTPSPLRLILSTKPNRPAKAPVLWLSVVNAFVGQYGAIYSEAARIDDMHLPRHIPEIARGNVSAFGRADRTIFVVDDQPLIRIIAVKVLEELLYEMLQSGDGPPAFENRAATAVL